MNQDKNNEDTANYYREGNALVKETDDYKAILRGIGSSSIIYKTNKRPIRAYIPTSEFILERIEESYE